MNYGVSAYGPWTQYRDSDIFDSSRKVASNCVQKVSNVCAQKIMISTNPINVQLNITLAVCMFLSLLCMLVYAICDWCWKYMRRAASKISESVHRPRSAGSIEFCAEGYPVSVYIISDDVYIYFICFLGVYCWLPATKQTIALTKSHSYSCLLILIGIAIFGFAERNAWCLLPTELFEHK